MLRSLFRAEGRSCCLKILTGCALISAGETNTAVLTVRSCCDHSSSTDFASRRSARVCVNDVSLLENEMGRQKQSSIVAAL